MSGTDSEPSVSEATVDAFLKDEGLWEEGMDRKQKMEVYKYVWFSVK